MAGEAAAQGIRAGSPVRSPFTKDALPRDAGRVVKTLNLVHSGSRSGPALARIQGATEAESVIGRMAKLSRQREDGVRGISGGSYLDPTTRTTVRVPPDPTLSDVGRAQQRNALETNATNAANDVLQRATQDLNTVLAEHLPVPLLGVAPELPGNRAGELQTLIALVQGGTYQQWRPLMQAAIDDNDVVRAGTLAYIARSQLAAWGGTGGGAREQIEADLQTAEDAFMTPQVMASRYAGALVGALHQGLVLASNLFQRPDASDQLMVHINTGAFKRFRAPDPQGDWQAYHDEVLASVVTPSESVWVLRPDGTLPARGRSSEAAGPLRTAADAGSRGT
jgi:hypothetical protein